MLWILRILAKELQKFLYIEFLLLVKRKKVGTTKGDGTAKNIVNIGLECLNLKIGR